MPSSRLRGIYSTALTKLLLDHGFQIVDPSDTIKERFRLRTEKPKSRADLDIYDRPDRQGVHVVGETSPLNSLISIMQDLLDDVIIRRTITSNGMVGTQASDFPLTEESMVRDEQGATTLPQQSFINIEFPAISKRKMDDYRSLVAPTIKDHHYLKACGGRVSSLLEMAEQMLEKNASRSEVETLLKESLMPQYPRLDSTIDIEHVKIDGRIFHLNNAKIVEFDEEEGRLRLLRSFRSRGIYDGLRVPREPDDYAWTDLRIGDWSFRTTYFSREGRYKGTYINLNTPIELYPEKIRYVDLEVDICLWPDGRIEKVDQEKLEEKVLEGYISERLSNIVKKKLEEIIDSLRSESSRDQDMRVSGP